MRMVTKEVLVLSLKIKSLLSNQNLRNDEKNLVALVLMTTLQSQDISALVTSSLFDFCIRLSQNCKDCFLSTICRVVKQIEKPNEYKWQDMTDALMSSLSSGAFRPETLADLLETIVHCLAMDHSLQIPADALDKIWERVEIYFQNFQQEKATTDLTSEFMIQAIEAVLGRFESDKQYRSSTAWMQPFVSLLQFLATRSCIAEIPKWYEAILGHSVSMDASFPEQKAWHHMTFACTNSLILLASETKFKNTRIVQPLIDLITAHLGSPQTGIQQSQVWETCSLLLTHCRRLTPSRRTTPSSYLCTWTRLAVGEYRIKLEMLCMEDSSTSHDTTLDAFVHIIEAALQLVVEEASDIDDGNAFSIEPAALLHLRFSFLDALQSTISYLCIPTATPAIAPCKMLGCILSEFSVWEDVTEGHTIMEVLEAVATAVSSGEDAMMECLVNVFASAEGNENCIQQLHRAGLLGNAVALYFARFWKSSNAKKGIPIQSACIAMESWLLLANPSRKQIRHLAKLVLGWVGTTIEGDNVKSLDIVPSVMAGIGCYLSLMGDRLPSEHDSFVIEQALLFCKKLQPTL